MRPSTFLPVFLLATTSATAPETKTKTKTKTSNRDYDAVVCGEDGFAVSDGYSYSANAWNPKGDGFQCLSILNSTSTSPAFDATWAWPTDPDSVHSYPHVTFSSSGQLPVPLSNISSLRLAASWAMGPGSSAVPSLRLDTTGLDHLAAKANVAFDMFLDRDPQKSGQATRAAYEVMIWIGTIGSPQPLGFNSGNASCYVQQLGDSNFTLYTGQNSRGTSVFTWVSRADEMSFDEDISPLLQYLWRNELVSADARLGLVEFGSEAYHSGGNVTFSAMDFGLDVWLGTPPRYDLTPIGDGCDAPQSSAGAGLVVVLFYRHGGLGLGGFFPLWLAAPVLSLGLPLLY